MMRYSVKSRDRIFVKDYGFLSFAQNRGKNIGKSFSGKQSQKLLDHSKQFATDALKTTSQRVIQKTAEATGDFIGNKIAIRITKVQKIYNKYIQRRLQLGMIKIYLKKDIYLQKKDKTLLMNWY